jgi:predicted Zn-dependent protease with MMP-like domain
MEVSKEQFELWVKEAIDNLPEKFLKKLNNVAFMVKDEPTKEQLKKAKLKASHILFGLYEGYLQSRKLNIGPVVPDKITIFRKSIISQHSTKEGIRSQIFKTIKHEIAHHFGSGEEGARKASR